MYSLWPNFYLLFDLFHQLFRMNFDHAAQRTCFLRCHLFVKYVDYEKFFARSFASVWGFGVARGVFKSFTKTKMHSEHPLRGSSFLQKLFLSWSSINAEISIGKTIYFTILTCRMIVMKIRLKNLFFIKNNFFAIFFCSERFTIVNYG